MEPTILAEVGGALIASIIGGGISGIAVMSRVRTEIEWLKKTIDRLERQQDTMLAAMTGLKLSALSASNSANNAADKAQRIADEISHQ